MRQPLTREAISTAARNILVAEGLPAVSLRRVAASLGVTAPALYAHVADKRDLLQGIAEREIDWLVNSFEAIEADVPVDRLRNMCLAYISYGIKNPDLFRAMFMFRPELTAESVGGRPALGEAIHAAFVDVVRSAYRQGMDAGDPALAAAALWATAHGVTVTLLSGPPLHVDLRAQLGEAAVNATLAGMCSGDLASAA